MGLNKFAVLALLSAPQAEARRAGDQVGKAIRNIEYFANKSSKALKPLENFQNIITCDACKITLKPLEEIFTNSLSQSLLKFVAKKICVDFKIAGGAEDVCDGMINTMADTLLPVVGNGIISGERICDELLHLCSTPKIQELNADDYVKERLASKPDFLKSNSYVNDIYKKISQSTTQRPIKRSIHLADLHVDFEYSVGSPTTCDLPICCRDWGTKSKHNSGKAGYWGDYNCDLP